MESFTIGNDVLTILKNNWDEIIDTNRWEGFDPEIIDILKDLNKLTGVQTLFSCSGHDSIVNDNKSFKSPYLMIAVTNEGKSTIENLYLLIQESITEELTTVTPPPRHTFKEGESRLSIKHNKDFIGPNCLRLSSTKRLTFELGEPEYIPVLILATSHMTSSHRDIYYKHFRHAISQL